MNESFSLKDFYFYLAVIALLAIALFFYNPVLGTMGAVFLAFTASYAYSNVKKYNSRFKDHFTNLHKDFEKVTERTIFSMPFPLVVTDETGSIVWHNSLFADIFDTDVLKGKSLSAYVEDLAGEDKALKPIENGTTVEIKEVPYRAFNTHVEFQRGGKEDALSLFYFVDHSQYKHMEKLYEDNAGVVLIVEVDNFDEVVDAAPASKKPLLIAEIDHRINEYFRNKEALVRKFQEDMYLVVMRKSDMEVILVDEKTRKNDLDKAISDLRELGIGYCGVVYHK